jgi:hypothetical protein
MKRENIENRVEEQYHTAFSDSIRVSQINNQEPNLSKETPSKQWKSELGRCRSKLKNQRFNLGAIKEYEQLQTVLISFKRNATILSSRRRSP